MNNKRINYTTLSREVSLCMICALITSLISIWQLKKSLREPAHPLSILLDMMSQKFPNKTLFNLLMISAIIIITGKERSRYQQLFSVPINCRN